MRVLVACEESQEVCKAFRERGHQTFSCDIQECSGGHPEWHIQTDVRNLLNPVYKWDMIIAFPPCTHLASSGARWFEQKRADGRQQEAIDFFMLFAEYPYCDKIAIENPVGIMSRCYRKPDQIIQPWQFGHPVSKKTCLWLKGLPELHSTNIVEYEKIHSAGKSGGYSGNSWYVTDENGKIIPWNDPRTAKARSKTFHGIALAMAEQWGK